MWPKEHGAYGQLLFPIVTALAMGRPSLTAFALALGAVAVFVAHEPLLVMAGARGRRAQRELGPRARRWLAGLASLAAAAVWTAWIRVPPGTRWTWLVPLSIALVAAWSSIRGQERTTAGEAVAGVALSSASFPVGVAAGLAVPVAAGCTAAFVVGTMAATLSVRGIIGRARGVSGAPGPLVVAVVSLGLVLLVAALAGLGAVHPAGVWGAFPVTLAALAVAVVAPAPRHLRRVGWTLIAATALAALVLLVGERLG
ncbi:MAG: YwiC-like family protein [Vicinamibacterales bacterium]